MMRVLGAVSIATLLFPSHLSQFFSIGISIGVVTVIASNIIGGLKNKIPFVTYSTDYPPIFLYSLVGAELFKTLPVKQFLPTLLLFIMLCTFFTGLVFWVVGRFKLSNLARFVPFPVVGGFMAGIGLLIFKQSLENLSHIEINAATFYRILELNPFLHWLPGAIFVGILFFGRAKIKNKFFPQFVILGTVLIFLVILFATGTPIEDAYVLGWSAKPVDSISFKPVFLLITDAPAWNLIFSHLGIFFTVVGVSLLSILITLAGLEISAKSELSFERELMNAGIVNMASGISGGAVSYQSVSTSMMNYKMGGRTRLVPVLTGVVGAVFLVFGWGASAIKYLPVALLSGLVLYVGVDFLKDWLIDSRKKMTATEYLILVMIMISIMVWGVIIGVALGILVATVLFTINYSKLKCIELCRTGKSLRSKVERPFTEENTLNEDDRQLQFFKLRGFLFFGSAEKILEDVRKVVDANHDRRTTLYVLFDFAMVTGIDSSAVLAFSKIFKIAEKNNLHFILVHVSDEIRSILESSIDPELFKEIRFFSRLDYALEWRENVLLQYHQDTTQSPRLDSLAVLHDYSLSDGDVKELLGYFKKIKLKKDEILFCQGDVADSMIIVDSGSFEVYISSSDGETLRLNKVIAGAVLGEIGIYMHTERTANVKAVTEAEIYSIDNESLKRMHHDHPELAIRFNAFVIGILAKRLVKSNNEILELEGKVAHEFH